MEKCDFSEYMSLRDIYIRSKKDDDLEENTFLTTGELLITIYYGSLNLPLREHKLNSCREIWKGLKILFVMKPNSTEFLMMIGLLEGILKQGKQVINEEFRMCRDLEIINYPKPDEDQRASSDRLNELLRINHKSTTLRDQV